jgi:hypothetical protein
VAGRVIRVVALRLDDHATRFAMDDRAPDQVTRHGVHGAIVEVRVELD